MIISSDSVMAGRIVSPMTTVGPTLPVEGVHTSGRESVEDGWRSGCREPL